MHRQKLFGLILALLCTISVPTRSLCAPENAGQNAECIRRADFQLTGAKCVLCLRRAAWSLRQQPGVIKADVSIFNPHWAVVIYNCKQTSFKDFMLPLSRDHISSRRLTETSLTGVPKVVVPLEEEGPH